MSDPTTAQERIRALEVQVEHLTETLDRHVSSTNEKHQSIDSKLDTLLALKHKGVGAFWLASSLVGAGFVYVVIPFFDWIKGLLHG